MRFSDVDLERLSSSVKKRMSEGRFVHTLGVKRCAEQIGRLVLPEKCDELSVAALLHDITKELPEAEQERLISEYSIPVTDEDRKTPGVIHSFTAPSVILRDFPEFATDDVLSAVECHTLGRADMTLFDKIIFLSDYIEDTRVYTLCVRAREHFFDGIDGISREEIIAKIDDTIVFCIDTNTKRIASEGARVNKRMLLTRDDILSKK